MIMILLMACILPSAGQTISNDPIEGEVKPGSNAIEQIVESSNGNVEIIIDDELKEKILTPPESNKQPRNSEPSLKTGINKMSGYRIQVFADGLNQHSLESRAKARGNAILAKFPKYRGQVYTFSSSPNWYTRVGNFRTESEANDALAQLRAAFPSFANEMRLVKCQIVIVR
ncbi:MAG: SPOR domain-containing protein [Muribaculaceae bacterium]|nr:SPOR domain-containing protein [Muribaculaceae bacterium]